MVEKGKALQVMEADLNEATTSLRNSLMAKLEDSERKLAAHLSNKADERLFLWCYWVLTKWHQR